MTGAILSGLYELIQRDGFLIHWLNKLAPVKIDPATIPDESFQKLLAESARYNFKIHCLNVTSDFGIPVFAVVLEDLSGNSPKYSLGGGCYANPVKALYRAFEEAWSIYYWIRPYHKFKILDASYRPFVSPLAQIDRLTFWANPAVAGHYQFFLSGKMIPFSELKFAFPSEFPSQQEELKEVVAKVERLGTGYEVYYYQAKHPLLTELGYYSVKVVVPQLFPLYLYEYNAPLGAERLKQVPPKIGFTAAEEINQWPHPFP